MAFKLIFSLFLIAISFRPIIASELSSSTFSVASEKSSLKNHRDDSAQNIPVITNEAEYAAWIKKREKASRASSTAPSQTKTSKVANSASSNSFKKLN